MSNRLAISIFVKCRRFLKKKMSYNAMVIVLSFFVGILGATAAIIVKNLMHFTVSTLNSMFPKAEVNYYYLAFPIVGIIITVLYTRKVVKDNIGHGVSIVLKSMFKSGGKLRKHNMYSSMIASTLTVGFGGSVGLEAPMALTGSAIGSNVAQTFNLNAKTTTLLLACGSTAALAAIFKAPVMAIVFALEVLMLDLTSTALLPLLISAATGTVLSILFLGDTVTFDLATTQAYYLKNIPFYILLGVFTGLISIYFLRLLRWIERQFSKLKSIPLKILIGGVLLGLLILLLPALFGEGYENINALLTGNVSFLFEKSPLSHISSSHWMLIVFLLAVIFLKVIATAVTTSAGGIGGVFAPTLFVGAFVGYLVAEVSNYYFGFDLPHINFVLAGMAGVMSGVMLAPLTSIFLIAEISSGYSLLIPLMITSLISYLCVSPIEKYSVYTRNLAEKGNLKTHNKDKFALQKINWSSIIDHNITTLPLHSTLGEFTQYIAKSRRNLFVVLDENRKFAGLLVMDDHRDKIFRQDLYDKILVDELMIEPEEFIYDTDTGVQMLEKFNRTHNFNMPVITQDREYLGFLSKSKVLDLYRDFIAADSED